VRSLRLGTGAVTWLRRLDLPITGAVFLLLAAALSPQRVTDFAIFCMFVLSYDLLYGHLGRLSFGHMLYFGTGAYAAALAAAPSGGNPLVAAAAAAAAGTATGLLLGPVAVRASGASFALINMAFNQVGHFLALIALASWTGGEDGLSVSFRRIGPFDPGDKRALFAFTLAALLLTLGLMRLLTGAPFGILLRSIKQNETRVRFLGYDVFAAKLQAFVASTTLAAFAGGLATVNYTYVTPSFIDPGRNVEVVFAALIGGAGSVYGAVCGGLAYMLISNFLPNHIQRWEMFLGLALLLLVFRFRSGIWGFLRQRFGPGRAEGA
jgi:branched-chain amino acid transport system permease protein